MHILITGDSWGCGEWENRNGDFNNWHTGIEQYLKEDGYSVENVSVGGANNLQSLDAIKNKQFDHLIFFFTDPLRQATYAEFVTISPKQIVKDHTEQILQALEKYPSVTLIGGCVKIHSNGRTQYNIPSISQLVIPDFEDSEYMSSWEWEDHWKNLTNPSDEFKHEIIDIYEKADKKYNLWKNNPKLFWPDGLHANRHAIKIVYEHMINLWKN